MLRGGKPVRRCLNCYLSRILELLNYIRPAPLWILCGMRIGLTIRSLLCCFVGLHFEVISVVYLIDLAFLFICLLHGMAVILI